MTSSQAQQLHYPVTKIREKITDGKVSIYIPRPDLKDFIHEQTNQNQNIKQNPSIQSIHASLKPHKKHPTP